MSHGAPLRAAQMDMLMMMSVAAGERTEAEWRTLVDKAGFKIKKIWKYTEECNDCIIVCVPQ